MVYLDFGDFDGDVPLSSRCEFPEVRRLDPIRVVPGDDPEAIRIPRRVHGLEDVLDQLERPDEVRVVHLPRRVPREDDPSALKRLRRLSPVEDTVPEQISPLATVGGSHARAHRARGVRDRGKPVDPHFDVIRHGSE